MTTAAAREVLAAAERRADALAARDARVLNDLMHPSLQWTTHTGAVLTREQYVVGNTEGALRWRSQRLAEPRVVVVGDTAVLTALVTDDVTRDGRDQTFTLRLTQTWVRSSEGWQCLAGHAATVEARRGGPGGVT
ncbi:MAG TPA: nuclear transport factor 2 family protein [Actinomycetes bacterium]|nr:nuclear transport factor 2 family protein [Actinomycetes bacterium]